MASGPGHETPPADVTAITFRTDAPRADVVVSGGVPLEDYRSFLIARGAASAIETLRQRGYRADPMPDASVVRFLAGPVEARDLGRSSAWTRNERGVATGVVHVHGPFKDAWQTAFEARGVDLLRYVPTNAFLVRGTPEALRGLTDLPFVDGVGPFDAAWKVRPGTLGVGIVDVRIAVLPGESPKPVLAELSHRGVPSADRAAAGPGILGTFGSGDFRWIRARMPSGLVPHIAALPYVEFIEPVRTVRPLNAETAWVLQTNLPGNVRYWTNGLDGRGQVVAISDTGVDYDHDQFRESAGEIVLGAGDLYNETSAARRKVVRYLNMGFLTGRVAWPGGGGTWDPWSIQDSDHTPTGGDCTFGHGTAVASVLTGNDNWRVGGGDADDGLALAAKLYVQDIGTIGVDPTRPLCAPNDEDLLSYVPEDLVDLFGPPGLVYNDPVAPVRIHSNSWGSDLNEYDIQARMVDAFVWAHPDLTVLFAAGNLNPVTGDNSVDTPGTAKNIVTVGGASNPDGILSGGPNDLAGQSSRGPTLDGRLKPTVLGIFDGDSGMSDGAITGAGGPDSHWLGTSYATPSAAAAAAIIRQYFVDGWYPGARPVPGNARVPSAALIRAMLIASGVQLTSSSGFRPGTDTWPNNEQGFGRIQLSTVLPISAAGDMFRTRVVDAGAGLVTGDEYRETVRTAGTGGLKFVLTWSDYPAALNAATALVNNLDLEVIAPDGTMYRGNNFGTFAQGRSIADGTFDATNVEEAVILKTPLLGDWTVRVIGANVPVGPQPFALVVTGDIDAAFGRVALDRPTYAPGDSVRLEVEDADAIAVQVRVTSGFDSAGETVSLTRAGPDAVWGGSVAVSFGPTTEPGVQVRDGDVLRATYTDASPAHTAVATARVDAVGPTIFNVLADRPGPTSAPVTWRTDEPATSGIWYGTAPTDLSSSVELTDLRTSHAATLAGLQPDTPYYYDVVARDRHGQETRDTFAGRHYRFRTSAFGDVLLVIGDDSFPADRETTWATGLDANAWTWSSWRNEDAGLPSLGVLQAHRAVLWQVGLEQYPPFDAAERDLVRQYLDAGGRLLVTSHDTTWALANPGSPFHSPDGEAWVQGVLKADFRCDPTSASRVRGLAGDPISGAYTASVNYLAHRRGGAVDTLIPLPAGGTTATVWNGDSVLPTSCGGQPIGLRWVSSAANGTTGVGTWGGTPSRLVYFAFEITGLDATRAQILDNAIRWLLSGSASSLDRDHPDVTLTSPNGGTFTGTPLTINWTAAAGSAPIATFDLSFSADGGESWAPLATVLGTARSYAWDIGSIGNGDRYIMRIIARDDGTPSLSGADETDGFLAIRRPSGDAVGPTIWAGSARVVPNPPGVVRAIWVQATADDTRSGGGTVVGAEVFLALSEPAPQDNGSGTPMEATDGAFDGSVEGLTWLDLYPLAAGPTCAWVHARDDGGSWGPYAATCFEAIDVGGPDVTPPTIALTDPAAGDNVSGVVSVNATAGDDEAVRRVDLQVDGGPVATDAAAPYSFRLDTRNFTDGTHVVRAVAFDLSGNSASDEIVLTFVNDRGPEPNPFPLGPTIAAAAVVAVVAVALLLANRRGRFRSRPPSP